MVRRRAEQGWGRLIVIRQRRDFGVSNDDNKQRYSAAWSDSAIQQEPGRARGWSPYRALRRWTTKSARAEPITEGIPPPALFVLFGGGTSVARASAAIFGGGGELHHRGRRPRSPRRRRRTPPPRKSSRSVSMRIALWNIFPRQSPSLLTLPSSTLLAAPPPPLNDNAGTVVVLPPYGPPRKLTVGQSQPSIDPAPPKHPRRVLFDIRAITDPARLRNAPVKEGDYERQCSRVAKRSPTAPIPIISHGMGAATAYADASLATSDLIRECHDDGCCFSHSCTRKCHRGKSLL